MKWFYLIILLIPIAIFELFMIRNVIMSTKKSKVSRRDNNKTPERKIYKNRYNVVK